MTHPDYETFSKMLEAQSTPVDDDGDYFSAEEIAAYLEVSLDEFFSRAAHADLQPVEVGGKSAYAGKDVERFLINLGVLEGESQW